MRGKKYQPRVLNIFTLCVCFLLSSATISYAAGICEPCTQNSDCDSNNCGVAKTDPSIRLCIPTDAVEAFCNYPAAPASDGGGGGGCFIKTAIDGSLMEPHMKTLPVITITN